MERRTTPLKIISFIDVGLAFIPIIYGFYLIIPPLTDYVMDQKNGEPGTPTDAPPGPIIHYDTQLTLAVYVTLIIIGVVGVHTVQAFMAILLFKASTKIVVEPLEACGKFKGYLIWSMIFLVFLLLVTIVYAALIFYFINWLIFSFLILQIIFRLFALYFVQSCRLAIRKQFLHSEVPWINPSLPNATL